MLTLLTSKNHVDIARSHCVKQITVRMRRNSIYEGKHPMYEFLSYISISAVKRLKYLIMINIITLMS